MKFTDDYSLAKMNLINKGFAELDIHSIRLDRYFNDEEKEQNSKTAKILSREQWNDRCDSTRVRIAEKNKTIMNMINNNFTLYQYEIKSKYEDLWDLFFWCNDLCNTTNSKETGRDMSYITLSFNDKMTKEQRFIILDKVKSLLQKYEENNVQVIVQYTYKLNNDVINYAAEKIFENIKENFVEIDGYGKGRIKLLADGYAFFKKGAKKYYYHLEPLVLCTQLIA